MRAQWRGPSDDDERRSVCYPSSTRHPATGSVQGTRKVNRLFSLSESLGVRDRVLHCNVCAQIKPVSPDEMLQYAKTTWPQCCNEVMTLLVPNTSRPMPPGSS